MKGEDLKCCGNCFYLNEVDMGDYIQTNCSTHKNVILCSEVCSDWQNDRMDYPMRLQEITTERKQDD